MTPAGAGLAPRGQVQPREAEAEAEAEAEGVGEAATAGLTRSSQNFNAAG